MPDCKNTDENVRLQCAVDFVLRRKQRAGLETAGSGFCENKGNASRDGKHCIPRNVASCGSDFYSGLRRHSSRDVAVPIPMAVGLVPQDRSRLCLTPGIKGRRLCSGSPRGLVGGDEAHQLWMQIKRDGL